jgi:hypothetical protein
MDLCCNSADIVADTVAKRFAGLNWASFLYLNGERCPFRSLFPLPFPLPPNLLPPSPNLLMIRDCGMIGVCWLLFVASVLMRLFMQNSACRLARVVV